MREIERRAVDTKIELRAKDGKKKTLVGYAAKFGARSEDLGGFVEELAPGCFDETLASGRDVLARGEHDSRLMLGRLSNGTLRLSVDDVGLRYEADLPETTIAADIATLVKDGYVSQSSFAFFVEDERRDAEWSVTDDKTPLRVLKRVTLVDVAPVANPAYQQTTVSARALDAAKGVAQPMKTKATPEHFRAAVKANAFRHLTARQPEERAVSYEEKLQKLWLGLCALLGYPYDYGVEFWFVRDTYDDRVIIQRGFQLLSYPLSWNADGSPAFGDPVQVEVEYVPVAPAATGGSSAEASGEARKEPAQEPVDLELERLKMEAGA